MIKHSLLAAAVGYLLGCIHPSYYFGKKIKNIDIRDTGSKNSGMSNAIIVLGWKYGLISGIIDIAKGFAAVIWVKLFLTSDPVVLYIAAASAVAGHIFPVFMHFRGGKGLATLFGTGLGINVFLVLYMLAALILAVALTDYMAVGTAATAITFAAYAGIRGGVVPLCLSALMALLIILKHLPNYRRIAAGGAGEVKMTFFIKQKGKKPDDLDDIDDFKNYKY